MIFHFDNAFLHLFSNYNPETTDYVFGVIIFLNVFPEGLLADEAEHLLNDVLGGEPELFLKHLEWS